MNDVPSPYSLREKRLLAEREAVLERTVSVGIIILYGALAMILIIWMGT
jgi:hypothetical protein